MRIALIALCVSSGLSMAQSSRVIDLDRPGVLDTIAQDNPAHYVKITSILDAASLQPCETLPKLLKTDYNVEDTKCSPFLLMASYPPKRHLTFDLDGIYYMSNVALLNLPKAEIKPAVPVNPIKPAR